MKKIVAKLQQRLQRNPFFFELSLRATVMRGRFHGIRPPKIKIVRKRLRGAFGVSMIMLSLLTMTAFPFGAPSTFSAPPDGSYAATGGRDANNPAVWNYTITEVGNAKDISHISLKTCFTTTELDNGVLVHTGPHNAPAG